MATLIVLFIAVVTSDMYENAAANIATSAPVKALGIVAMYMIYSKGHVSIIGDYNTQIKVIKNIIKYCVKKIVDIHKNIFIYFKN